MIPGTKSKFEFSHGPGGDVHRPVNHGIDSRYFEIDMEFINVVKQSAPGTVFPYTLGSSFSAEAIHDPGVGQYLGGFYIFGKLPSPYWGSQMRGHLFMKFSELKLTAVDELFTIQLDGDAYSGSESFGFHRAAKTWDPSTLTWANKPTRSGSLNFSGAPVFNFSKSPRAAAGSYVEMLLTSPEVAPKQYAFAIYPRVPGVGEAVHGFSFGHRMVGSDPPPGFPNDRDVTCTFTIERFWIRGEYEDRRT